MTGLTGFCAGYVAEDIVAADYQLRQCEVAARRWRGQSGEVDLVVRDGNTLVFVEVKKSKSFAAASARLGRRQMDRICRAASEFLASEPAGQLTDARFDLALVNAQGAVSVIENAFMEA